MKNVFLFLWLVLSAIANAQQVVVRSNVNLRSAPTTDSRILYKIPQGTTINLNGCESDWCEISISGHSGFVSKQHTVSRGDYSSSPHQEVAHPIGPINHYTNSKGNVVQSPTHYDRPPSRATAKCRDGSYSFSQSTRGTCSHHGGVAQWLQ